MEVIVAGRSMFANRRHPRLEFERLSVLIAQRMVARVVKIRPLERPIDASPLPRANHFHAIQSEQITSDLERGALASLAIPAYNQHMLPRPEPKRRNLQPHSLLGFIS